MRAWIRRTVLMLAALVGPPTAVAAPLYTVLDMGAGAPVAIDNTGRIIGIDAGGSFLTQPAQAIRAEDHLPAGAKAVALSPGGTLLGVTEYPSPAVPQLWNGTSWQPAAPAASSWSGVSSVNDAGRAVGWEGGSWQIADPGMPTFSVAPPSGKFAFDPGPIVAQDGSVYGTFYSFDSLTLDYVPQGYVWNGATLAPIAALDYINGVNASGDVVGRESVFIDDQMGPGGTLEVGRATAIVDGIEYQIYQNLAALGHSARRTSSASAVNESGEVVGSSELGAFYFADGELVLLQDRIVGANPFSELSYASDINDSGQIVGAARTASGETHVFLLTPIPEPATATLLTLGIAALRPRGRRSD